jgi:transposase
MTSQRSHTITGVAAATGEMLGVVRVPTRLMANSRRASRERGKSDLIDALPVARAALAEGIETLPTAELAGPELDIRLLVDHRERHRPAAA